jgi:Pectate lyase superfamily protein
MPEITSYTALTTPGNYDVIPIVDVSDPAQSEAGTTKKITYLDLTQGLSGGGGGGGGGSQLPWINVTDAPYNADGSGESGSAAANTTAIQDAINAAGSGGVVYFPPGNYPIDAALDIPVNITLMGDNEGSPYNGLPTVISQTSTSAHGLFVANAWNVVIKGLAVTGPGYVWETLGTGTGTGIYMAYTGEGPSGFNSLDGVFIAGFGGSGLYANTAIMSTFSRVWAAYNGQYGVYFAGGTSSTFDSCWAPGNGEGGWYIDNVNYCTWNACGADANTGNGWTVGNAQGCAWNGCGAEQNTGNPMNWIHVWGSVINGFWCSNAAVGLNVDSTSYNCTVTGFVETPLSGAEYGCVLAAGSQVTLIAPQMTDAQSIPAQYSNTTLIEQGTISTGHLVLGTALPVTSGGTGGTTAAAAIAALVGSGIPECAFTGAYSPAVSTLTFSTTIAVNAALANDFRITLTNSTATVGAPSNAVNGQQIVFHITQPAGGNTTVQWATGTGGYDFGSAWTAGTGPTLSGGGSKTDVVRFVYNSTKSAWLFLEIALGF